MYKYYVRIKPQLNGENVVHEENCPFLDGVRRKRYLGEFISAQDAINEAQRFYEHSKGCLFCNKRLIKPPKRRNTFWHSYSLS